MPGPSDLTETVRAGVEAALDGVFVARPGRVTAYDPITCTAVVQPMVKHALYDTEGERSYEDLPEIPFVPILFARAGGNILSLPVEAGDMVLLVFCDVSLAEWRTTGEASEPTDARRHSLGWPVAIPGFFPDSSPPSPLDTVERTAGAMIFGEDGSTTTQLLVNGTIPGFRFGKAAVSPVALAVPLLAHIALQSAAIVALQTEVAAIAAALVAVTNIAPLLPAHVAAAGAATGAITTSAPTVAAGAAVPVVSSTLVKAL